MIGTLKLSQQGLLFMLRNVDAWVTDPSVSDSQGIAEFKRPYSKAFVHPLEACKDVDFFCSMTNQKFHLKRMHAYYHQVQLQLHVSLDYAKWCDFCVYTTCGVTIKRIYPDPTWKAHTVLSWTIITWNAFYQNCCPEKTNQVTTYSS